MLRYALLRHECPADYRDGPHWDLMLERPKVADEHRLATWSLLNLPAAWARRLGLGGASDEVDATSLDDHRAWYLDNDGPLSGDRGSVTRIDAGPLAWEEQSNDVCCVQLLEPGALAGQVRLTRNDDAWRLSVEPTDATGS